MTFNRKFSVGMTLEAMAGSNFEAKDDQIKDLGLASGLLLQYVLGSTRLLHGTLDAIIGNGGYCVAGPADDCDWSRFIYVEPSVNLELNLHKHTASRRASAIAGRSSTASTALVASAATTSVAWCSGRA